MVWNDLECCGGMRSGEEWCGAVWNDVEWCGNV